MVAVQTGNSMITAFETLEYARMRAQFRWPRPARFNMAQAACADWAAREPERLAVIQPGGQNWRYGQLARASNQWAHLLAAPLDMGGAALRRGERLGVLLPQRVETVLAHLAAYRLGALALPLFTLFGEEGLAFRLGNAEASAVITDRANLPKILAIREQLPQLRAIYCVDGPSDAIDIWAQASRASDAEIMADTGPDDPAFISYTSGTTGQPKGALHAHRVLIGHLPGVQMWLEGVPKPGDVIWTPADWAWMGGLTNILLPALAYGIPVVAQRFAKFDPEAAFRLMQDQRVSVGFLPPTALKMMRDVPRPRARFELGLRAIGSGGESLGAEVLEWGRGALGVTINEFYGQTECNLVLSNMGSSFPARPGSMGRPVPGHEVAVIDSQGQVLPPGEVGEIAIRRPDPVMFLEYWRRPDATRDKFIGDWMRTGDEGRVDEDGYFWFSARADDVISSAGYRIGPGEIEDCLVGHAAVRMAGAVGIPDALRGEVIHAFVVLKSGQTPEPALAEALREHVRTRLSPHETPRQIHFVAELPMTATGKIMRRELKRSLLEKS